MIKYWLFACLLILSQGLFSQLINRDTIQISGVVLSSDSLTALANVHITTQKQSGGITDVHGAFSFKINKKDTLTFSYVGFKPYIYVVPDTLKINNYIAGVILNPDTISLSEVIILPWMNRKQFKQSFIQNTPDQNTLNATRNLNIAGHTAKTTSYHWTPDAVIDMQLKSYAMDVEYRGMINPKQQVNFIGLAQLLIIYAHQQLSKEEKAQRLKEELKQYIRETHPK